MFTVFALVAMTAGYFYMAYGQPGWPGGSSGIGFAYGIVGGLVILFEFLLWPRKHLPGLANRQGPGLAAGTYLARSVDGAIARLS